jgi:hypothetical protein
MRTDFGTGSNAVAVRGSKVCIAGWFYNDAYIGLDTLESDTDPMLAAFDIHRQSCGAANSHYLFVEDAQDVVIDASGNVATAEVSVIPALQQREMQLTRLSAASNHCQWWS